MVYAIVFLVILWVVAGLAHNKTTKRLRERMAIIERENRHLAGGIVKAQKAAQDADAKTEKYFESDHNAFTNVAEAGLEADAKIESLNQRLLTLENKQPKIAPRPTRVNFRQFREAAERASEPQETE